jgi:hypothetical protein
MEKPSVKTIPGIGEAGYEGGGGELKYYISDTL